MLKEGTLSSISVAKDFLSWAVLMMLKIPNETFLWITRYIIATTSDRWRRGHVQIWMFAWSCSSTRQQCHAHGVHPAVTNVMHKLTNVMGLVRSLIRLYRSLVCLLRTACFTRSRALLRSLAPELGGQWNFQGASMICFFKKVLAVFFSCTEI